MRRLVALVGTAGLCLFAGIQPAFAGDSTMAMPPHCEQVTGDGSVTYSWNAGQHLTSTSQQLALGTTATDVRVTRSGRLLTVTGKGRLSESDDAGCTWTSAGQLDGEGPFRITPAPDGSAYVWTEQNDLRIYRVTASTVTEVVSTTPTYGFMDLVVDPADALHLRLVDGGGRIFDSVDGGFTFRQIGTAPTSPSGGTVGLYDAAIAPGDLDRVVLGTLANGAFTSADGGRTWTRATMAPSDHRINVFTAAVSPVDPAVVWVMGLDITEHDNHADNEGRHIYRSTDGGRTFQAVVDHATNQVTLTNGLLLVPHPTDPDRVYFEFGTWYAAYGTDLFAYDAGLDKLTSTHNPYDDITAIAFHPRFPALMYLGLSEQR